MPGNLPKRHHREYDTDRDRVNGFLAPPSREICDAVELDGTIRVWGWIDQIAEGKMEWRLVVRLVG